MLYVPQWVYRFVLVSKKVDVSARV